MRLLRELGDERQAQLLADALHDQGIESDLRSGQGATSVWVHDELVMDRAEELARKWLDEGDERDLSAAARRGRQARERQQLREKHHQQQLERVQQALEAATRPRPTPLTWALIALCVGTFMVTNESETRAVAAKLWIADPGRLDAVLVQLGSFAFYWLRLPWDEPWRLLTPIIVHADFLHIAFNMMWLLSLGAVLERRHGSAYMLAFIVVCGALSNIAQFEIGRSPAFAGMSGVVYGLLGLMWIRGRLDPGAGYVLSGFTVQFMLLWLVLGFVVPNMHSANWCHLGGLAVGAAWGALAARRSGARRAAG